MHGTLSTHTLPLTVSRDAFLVAKEDRDIVEIYCGDAMKRFLGYPVDESESRTIDVKADDKNPTVVKTDEEPVSNSTKHATPNVVSDMGK